MLQIISGKFYKTKETYSFERKAILYSNFRFPAPIRTNVGTLDPVDILSPVATYVFYYKNELEKDINSQGFSLVSTGDPEIVNQFMLLCSFGLKAFFATEKNEVILNCRSDRQNVNDKYHPSKFIGDFFNSKINATEEEVSDFINFINKVIGLPRNVYRSVITCLQNLYYSFQTLNFNVDLSYSLIVYCLESLSQTFDQFEPVWEDYNQKTRLIIDPLLETMEQNIAYEIKNALLTNEHLKLQKRFIEFVKKYLNDPFFQEEAENINFPLKKLDIEAVLRNAYDMRSKYVHQLRSVLKHLTIPQISQEEVFYWEHNPYLTYSGFIRLVLHVLNNFINDQPYLVHEDYPWRNDLPGTISM